MPSWREVFQQIQVQIGQGNFQAQMAVDSIRHRYLNELQNHTRRNVIAYYSGFLSKPAISESEITDEDMNGFMMAVHGLKIVEEDSISSCTLKVVAWPRPNP